MTYRLCTWTTSSDLRSTWMSIRRRTWLSTLTEKSHKAHMWDTCETHVNTCVSHVISCVVCVLFQFHMKLTCDNTCDPTCDIMWPHGKFSAAVCTTWDVMCAYVMLCGLHVWRCGHMWPTCATHGPHVPLTSHMCVSCEQVNPHGIPMMPHVMSCGNIFTHVSHMWA